MRIRDYLIEISQNYDRSDPLSSPTQLMLRGAEQHFNEHVPAGIIIRGSGGQGNATMTPWVAFLDPDETTTPQNGLYVVYLFSTDLQSVTLTLQHGVTKVRQELGPQAALARLSEIAIAVRNDLPFDMLRGMEYQVNLGQGGWRQSAYSAGNVVAKRYATNPCQNRKN